MYIQNAANIQYSCIILCSRLSKMTTILTHEFIIISKHFYMNIIDHNWLLKSVVRDLTPETAENSIYEYIESTLGETIMTTLRKLTVERRTEMDQNIMDLRDYNCVVVVASHTYNSMGVMFEYTESRHRPDRFVFYNQAKRSKR